jgi:hypothetical protein
LYHVNDHSGYIFGDFSNSTGRLRPYATNFDWGIFPEFDWTPMKAYNSGQTHGQLGLAKPGVPAEANNIYLTISEMEIMPRVAL